MTEAVFDKVEDGWVCALCNGVYLSKDEADVCCADEESDEEEEDE